MAVVQYQNYCSPGFGLVARHPLQRLKRLLAKGAVPVLGEAWRAWAAGADWLRGSAVPQHPLRALCSAGAWPHWLCVPSGSPVGSCPSLLQLPCTHRTPGANPSEPRSALQVSTELVGIALIPRGRCAVWS